MAYEDFKDLAKRTAADNVLSDLKLKVFNIAKDLKYDGYQRGLASMVYQFFHKKTAGSGIKSIPQNKHLAEELHFINQLLENIKKKSIFNIQRQYTWGANLLDM